MTSKMGWCPGAESNHRHEDFQSTALPLSYPGTGRTAGPFGCRRSRRAWRGCPEGIGPFSVRFGTVAIHFRSGLFGGAFGILGVARGHGVIAAQPAAEVDVRAAFRAEGPQR